MKVILSKRGERSARRIAERWNARADSPNTFALELIHMMELLTTTRSPGSPYPRPRRPGLKRLLLKKSHCHVYFVVDERRQVLTVLEIWDARRSRPPKL